MHRLYATFTLGLLLSLATRAHAQVSDKKLAEANRVAMEAYNNLDIETSKKALEDAIKNAERANAHGPALARTYANLGVVVVGGLGDGPAGVDAFMHALKEDPNVEPDPVVSTPEVMTAFNTAKRKVASGAPAKPIAAVAAAAPPPAAVQQGPIEGNLAHTPAAEQLSQTAVPVYVAKGGVEAETLKIFYRSLGMSKPKSAEMHETEDGFTYLIPCTDVFEPSVEYFIIAEDDDGDQVGNAGTPQRPVVVPVVTARTQSAPALPGQAPPQQCGAVEECPPGMPGCSSGTAQLGDTCRSSSECSSGLRCVDDFCSMSDGDDEEDDDDNDRTGQPRWFLDVGAGVGATYVGEGKTADRPPSVELVSEAQRFLEEGRAGSYLFDNGYDCDVTTQAPLVASNCKVAVKQPGFVAVPLISFAAGYYLTPKVALALIGRIQLQRGEGPLAGIGVGARVEYQMTKPAAKGFHAGFLAGVGLGTIQARPGTESQRKGPYATSAQQGGVGALIHLGFRVGYRFHRYFGLQATPMLSMGIPTFLPSLDISAGPEIAF
jgi:hypothetical protein